MTQTPSAGEQLRQWRQRRRLSQMDLALDAEISTKHLSFLETGRARPSKDMALRLAERLEIPLREQNLLLMAAGHAPVFPERPMEAPDLAPARRAVELILKGHEPFPALAVDRRWNLVSGNATLMLLLDGVAPELLAGQVNVLRLSLHPQGLAPRIANLTEWRGHLLARLRREIELTADRDLEALHEELRTYPAPPTAVGASHGADFGGIAIPLRLNTPNGQLSFLSTTTVFGTAVDVTLSELTLETFFPADAATAEVLRGLALDGESRQTGAAA